MVQGFEGAATPTSSVVVAKYELVRPIGRGGMGTVWKARHVSLGTEVAIKFLDADGAATVEATRRFDNEARATARIRSKNAVRIFDHGVTEAGHPFIVMELLTGETLEQCLERVGRLSLTQAARVVAQVSRALSHAHALGIVHRDLKPENVFLVRDPEEPGVVAKVLDFGVAKMFAAADLSWNTETGVLLGTPLFMSPEQIRGSCTIDGRSDIWSLGVVAYRAVTGRNPFEAETLPHVLMKICQEPVARPSSVLPGLPDSFDAWIATALAPDPARRFPTVSVAAESLVQLAEDARLGEAATEPSIPLAPPSVPRPTAVAVPHRSLGSGRGTLRSAWLRKERHVAPVAVAAAAVALLVFAFGAIAPRLTRCVGSGRAAAAGAPDSAGGSRPSSPGRRQILVGCAWP